MDGAACVQLCSDPPIFKYKLTALTFRICLVCNTYFYHTSPTCFGVLCTPSSGRISYKKQIVVCKQYETLLEDGVYNTSKHFYSKTNQMHNNSDLLYIGSALYMFPTVFPSIIRSLRLYTQHQSYVIQVQPTAC